MEDRPTKGQTNLPIEAHIWLKIVFMDGNPFEAYQKSKIMWKLLPVLKLNSLVNSGKIILRRQSSSGSSARQQHWSIHSTTPLRTNVASFIDGLYYTTLGCITPLWKKKLTIDYKRFQKNHWEIFINSAVYFETHCSSINLSKSENSLVGFEKKIFQIVLIILSISYV